MRLAKILLMVIAVHLAVLSFLFFKPAAEYFAATGLSTIVIWATLLNGLKKNGMVPVLIAFFILISIQQTAYYLWQKTTAGIGWPLAQFLALQYIVVTRLRSRN